eukprot:Rhum_TRINITY_DN14575_c14_g10::Rhum_TRINITY_DN14575_c14_g10_i1::g.99349::m.99349
MVCTGGSCSPSDEQAGSSAAPGLPSGRSADGRVADDGCRSSSILSPPPPPPPPPLPAHPSSPMQSSESDTLGGSGGGGGDSSCSPTTADTPPAASGASADTTDDVVVQLDELFCALLRWELLLSHVRCDVAARRARQRATLPSLYRHDDNDDDDDGAAASAAHTPPRKRSLHRAAASDVVRASLETGCLAKECAHASFLRETVKVRLQRLCLLHLRALSARPAALFALLERCWGVLGAALESVREQEVSAWRGVSEPPPFSHLDSATAASAAASGGGGDAAAPRVHLCDAQAFVTLLAVVYARAPLGHAVCFPAEGPLARLYGGPGSTAGGVQHLFFAMAARFGCLFNVTHEGGGGGLLAGEVGCREDGFLADVVSCYPVAADPAAGAAASADGAGEEVGATDDEVAAFRLLFPPHSSEQPPPPPPPPVFGDSRRGRAVGAQRRSGAAAAASASAPKPEAPKQQARWRSVFMEKGRSVAELTQKLPLFRLAWAACEGTGEADGQELPLERLRLYTSALRHATLSHATRLSLVLTLAHLNRRHHDTFLFADYASVAARLEDDSEDTAAAAAAAPPSPALSFALFPIVAAMFHAARSGGGGSGGGDDGGGNPRLSGLRSALCDARNLPLPPRAHWRLQDCLYRCRTALVRACPALGAAADALSEGAAAPPSSAPPPPLSEDLLPLAAEIAAVRGIRSTLLRGLLSGMVQRPFVFGLFLALLLLRRVADDEGEGEDVDGDADADEAAEPTARQRSAALAEDLLSYLDHALWTDAAAAVPVANGGADSPSSPASSAASAELAFGRGGSAAAAAAA